MKFVKFALYAIATLMIVLIISIYIWHISRPPTKLELFVFDTKGKPSIFIRTPEDIRILINGGANSGVIRYITNELPFYSRRIDTVIVTSDEGGQISGLIDVIDRYRVGQVIVPAITAKKSGFSSSTDQIYETLMSTIKALHTPMREVEKGDQLDFGTLSGDILFPEAIDKFKYSKSSPPELAIRFSYGRTSFMLLGDLGTKAQKYLVDISKPGDTLISDVLIVPHNTSASVLFPGILNAIKPEFVVYSQAVNAKAVNVKESNKTNSLYMILDDHRFNIKQKSTIEVLSDGKSVQIVN